MKLYIIEGDLNTFLINIPEENAKVLKENGWKVYELGLGHPKVPPGIILCTVKFKFEENLARYKELIKL